MTLRRSLTRFGAPLAAGFILALGVAAPSSAHVGITASTTSAGAYSILTVSVPHGCEGSATTRIAVQIPEEILSVTPTRNSFWSVEKKVVQLDAPATDTHGNMVTERVGSVVYTALKPLPDGQRDTLELSLQLPEREGTLTFPTVQTCEQGQVEWTEVAAGAGSEEELEHPAPTVVVTAAGLDAHQPALASSASTAGVVTAASAPDDDMTGTLAGVGLAAGLLGLLAGGTSLVLQRRRA